MPLLFPASIEEYVRFGLAGIALSRFSGLWIGFKAVTEIIESAGSISQPTLPRFQNPDFEKPVHGLNFDSDLQWPAQRSEYKRRVLEERITAAQDFCCHNNLDVTVATVATGRVGNCHGR